MKRIGGLFDPMIDVQTLTFATWRAGRGKHNRPEVRNFIGQLGAGVAETARALRAGTFRFGAYRRFAIRDPKSRTIHAPPFRDRVVHHAIVAVAGPGFELGASAHSYACRAGRGQHAALEQARRWLRPDDWFLKIDVAKFYDSVRHDLLRAALARRFRETRLLALFDALLNSYCSNPAFPECRSGPRSVLNASSPPPDQGLPIGALTSQYLGNFYLDPFDHWMLQVARQPRTLRYMDDVLTFGSHAALREVRDRASTVLAGLGLKIKDGGVLNRVELGVPFLGFTLYPDRTRLNPAGRKRLRRRTHELERTFARGAISEAELQARSTALFAHARGGDDVAWRRTMLRFSRLGEAPAPATRDARRLMGQHAQEVPLGLSQQEASRQPQQESGLPPLSGPRHGGSQPPDDAPSRARRNRDETTESPPRAEIQAEGGAEKARGGAEFPAS